jgi:predicted ATPase
LCVFLLFIIFITLLPLISYTDSIYRINSNELASLIFKKTQGNPFFINQLLHILHKNKHIKFVKENILENENGEKYFGLRMGGWVCDTNAITKANYTSNVVDMMVGNFSKLPTSVQQLLGVAATIGNRFEVDSLSLICERDINDDIRTLIKYNSKRREYYLTYVFYAEKD